MTKNDELTVLTELTDVNQMTQVNTATHINKFVCSNCGNNFTTKNALSRHINHRCVKNQVIKQNIDLVSDLKRQNEYLLKRNADLTDDKEYLKTLVEGAGHIVLDALATTKSSINTLNYIAETFVNAPLLKPIQDYTVITNDNDDREAAIVLSERYKDGTLIKYLGELLVAQYKKQNPEEQSLWNSDCSRLSYIIRTVVGNKPSWIADKKGVQLKECVINPLLSHINNELVNFIYKPKKIDKNNINIYPLCIDLVKDIRSSIIGDDLLKFLAPHFQIKREKLKKIIT
jgi:hypothetical protein